MTNSRREFLKAALAAAAGSASQRATFGLFSGLGSATAFAQSQTDYKALVCVFLAGGADSWNLLVRRDLDGHAEYAERRSNMAIERTDLQAIDDDGSGPRFGLHPDAGELAGLFRSRRLGFVANVGPLVAPISVADYRAGRDVPMSLFSHEDQQKAWARGDATGRGVRGWGGAIADLVGDVNNGAALPLNVTLAGINEYQAGLHTTPYAMNSNGVITLKVLGANPDSTRARAFTAIMNSARNGGDLFERYDASVTDRTIRLANEVADALAATQEIQTPFPDSAFADQLKVVAQMIAARDELGVSRQIFFVKLGGWDTHANQVTLLSRNYNWLSEGLGAFDSALQELGIDQSVTTFTQSDFGRTLTSNGDGTDHGWGSVQLVTGGAVQGGQIYGEFPSLAADAPQDLGNGRLLPTTSVDQYANTLARWFGAGDDVIGTMLPNLGNFPVSAADLGFLDAV